MHWDVKKQLFTSPYVSLNLKGSVKVDLRRLKWTKCDAETAAGEKGNVARLSQRWREFIPDEIGMRKRKELLERLCVLCLSPCVCARNDVSVGPAVSVGVFVYVD